MHRARRAAVTALLFALLLSASVPAGREIRPVGDIRPLAAVSWPVSTLVLSEVVTGGTSASDEFVELANQGPLAVDLAGLEVAYATSSGATITRKGTWSTTQLLEPGQRVLLANSLGSFAVVADLTYSGGLSASGGALVLRPVGGTAIDAIGWGDAVNAFVEGTAVPASPASSSLERHPGGAGGNGIDTNDNGSDWFVQGSPSPQGLSSPPVPAPGPTPSPEPTSTPPPMPTMEPTPTAEPTPTPTTEPTPAPTETPTPAPTASPEPSPSPSPVPTPTATPIPVIAIAQARLQADGSTATVVGTLTTPLGALEDGHAGFIQDGTGAIALYLDAPLGSPLAAGSVVRATGLVDSRFAQRTLRVASADVEVLGSAPLPVPLSIATGAANEAAESLRVVVAGTTVGSPSALADGLGLVVDDGTGSVRVIVTPVALGGADIPAGSSILATGPLGQRDSSGTGTEGYRILVTDPSELELPTTPTPTPTASVEPSPSPTPSASPAPTATPSASPSPTPTPSATASPSTIAYARGLAPGTRVTVEGVVTAPDGRLGSPGLIAVQDATAGIVVRLANGAPAPGRGARIRVTGVLADPYGQTEARPLAGGVAIIGSGPLPAALSATRLGETTEGRVVFVQGVQTGSARRSSSGDVSLDLRVGSGLVRIMADESTGLQAGGFLPGATYRMTGIGAQRATHKGALDGYRLWLRDARDVVLIGRPGPSPSPGPSQGPRPSPGNPVLSIARALLLDDRDVTVEGVVTVGAALLDSSGRRIVIQDASAAVEVLVPSGSAAPAAGSRLRVSGEMGRAYGAPRLRADEVRKLGRGAMPAPIILRRSPTAAHEWRLARATGIVTTIERSGDRWSAELAVGGQRLLVIGLAGSEIGSSLVVEGRQATVTGIVKRPYPTSSDRRFSLIPRERSDIVLSPESPGARPSDAPGANPSTGPSTPNAAPGELSDVYLDDLARHVGRDVRVGGLIVELGPDGVALDDGTATGWIVLRDSAAAYLPLLERGDAINASGRVERGERGIGVVVRAASGIARVGDPGTWAGPSAMASPDAAASSGRQLDAPRAAALGAIGDPFGLGVPGYATLASLGLVSLASLLATMLRRERLRRRLAASVLARMAGLTTRPDAPRQPPDGPS
jgi:lamin tail-like protein